MYDASNRKDVRRAEKAADIAERERIDYLAAAMSTRQGRIWFYDFLEFCHLFNDPFTGDSLAEAYRKGERNVGLRIFADIIAHCPDSYLLMMKEAYARAVARTVAESRAASGERPIDPNPDWGDQGSDPDSTDLIGAQDE